MSDLTTIDFSNLFCLFKGEPGTRKSTCALSFPKPQYWFSYDQKMDALVLPMKAWNINPADIIYHDYNNYDVGLAFLEKFQFSTKPSIPNGPSTNGKEIKTIVIDSITSLGDGINRQTLKTKRGEGTGKMIAGIPVNSIEDFNAEDSALKEIVALCKAIKKEHKVNIVLIAHIIQKDQKSADGSTHVSRTLLTAGKAIAQKIPAYCSEIYHFNIKTGFDMSKGGQYALLTTHTGDDFARTSLPLSPEIQFGNDPLYDKWIKPKIDEMMGRPKSFT